MQKVISINVHYVSRLALCMYCDVKWKSAYKSVINVNLMNETLYAA